MIELSVRNRRFVKYLKKLISSQNENFFADDSDLIDAMLSPIVRKNEYALLYSVLIVFAVFFDLIFFGILYTVVIDGLFLSLFLFKMHANKQVG